MIDNLPAFIGVALLLNLSPGPDQIYILGRTLAQGRFIGFVSSWGVCSGALVHVFAAAFGFSLIIKSSPTAYAALKYVGAAYMVWLAINALRHNVLHIDKDSTAPQTAGKAYLQGILVDLLNPKVAIIFLAFLPQFISSDCAAPVDRVSAFIALGGIVILIGLIWEGLLVFFSDLILGRFLQNQSVLKYLHYMMAAVFMGLAVHIVFFSA